MTWALTDLEIGRIGSCIWGAELSFMMEHELRWKAMDFSLVRFVLNVDCDLTMRS